MMFSLIGLAMGDHPSLQCEMSSGKIPNSMFIISTKLSAKSITKTDFEFNC